MAANSNWSSWSCTNTHFQMCAKTHCCLSSIGTVTGSTMGWSCFTLLRLRASALKWRQARAGLIERSSITKSTTDHCCGSVMLAGRSDTLTTSCLCADCTWSGMAAINCRLATMTMTKSIAASAVAWCWAFSRAAVEVCLFSSAGPCCQCANCTLSCRLCSCCLALCRLAGRSAIKLRLSPFGCRGLTGPAAAAETRRTGWCCGRRRAILMTHPGACHAASSGNCSKRINSRFEVAVTFFTVLLRSICRFRVRAGRRTMTLPSTPKLWNVCLGQAKGYLLTASGRH